jgi:hypothetical protein
MHALLAIVALAFGWGSQSAQSSRSVSVAQQPTADTSISLDREIEQRRTAGDHRLPDASHFTFGNRTIEAGTVVAGPVAIARGTLDVYGTVEGDVIAVDGDIRVHPGARITGDAFAAAGTVLIEGGVIDGAKRAIAAPVPALPVGAVRAPLTVWQSVKLAIGCFAVLTIIGLGVMIFAEGNLDGVVIALEHGFARAFWMGLAGQLLLAPVLLVLVAALFITVIGVLLIPFAIVAYVIAAMGVFTLGFLAVARLTGGVLASRRGATSPRGMHLRSLITGLILYAALWVIAALFTWNPLAGAVLRTIAFAITWVAGTLGFGATIASRGGTQRAGSGSAGHGPPDELGWQTPTPVAGVAAAARRPVTAVQ